MAEYSCLAGTLIARQVLLRLLLLYQHSEIVHAICCGGLVGPVMGSAHRDPHPEGVSEQGSRQGGRYQEAPLHRAGW